MATAASQPLTEAFGDWVDPQDRLRDDIEFNGVGSYGLPYTNIDDRKGGAFFPVYRTEFDLAMIRGVGRNLGFIDGVAVGALTALGNYVLGATGFKFQASVADGLKETVPPLLKGAIQRIIDEFVDRNDFCGELDRELHDRSREDGEALITLQTDQDGVVAEVIEPDQLRQPAESAQLHDWLLDQFKIDCESFVPCWKFGVLTPENHTSQALGYHIVYDGSGADWDFVPATHAMHFKRNVPRNVKRGVSDYFPIIEDMRSEAKLSKNMVLSAALQASIPWIEEVPPGTTQAQSQALGTAQADLYTQRPRASGTSRITNVRSYRAGTILRPSPGMKYVPGPMGAERNNGFIEVGGYVMRRIGIRWSMPEYMISGDASNANFASTVEATSPFVKAREADQQWYGRRFHNLLWKVLRIEFNRGRLDRFGMTWDQICQCIDITFKGPEVASSDTLKLVQTVSQAVGLGIMSPRTGATKLGLDYDEEAKLGAKPQAVPSQGQGAPGVPPMEPRTGLGKSIQESFSESDHPRDDNGKFVSGSRIEAAKSDPKLASQLRSEVTKPEQLAKLNASLKSDSPAVTPPPQADKSRQIQLHVLHRNSAQFENLRRSLGISGTEMGSRGEENIRKAVSKHVGGPVIARILSAGDEHNSWSAPSVGFTDNGLPKVERFGVDRFRQSLNGKFTETQLDDAAKWLTNFPSDDHARQFYQAIKKAVPKTANIHESLDVPNILHESWSGYP